MSRTVFSTLLLSVIIVSSRFNDELKLSLRQSGYLVHIVLTGYRVGAALDLLEQGEPLEKIMLRGGWQTDSTAISYLRNWIV
jgi:hypothetical protein